MSTARDQAPVDTALQRASWDADRSVDLVDFTVGELLADRANAHPDRVAIVGVRHGTGEQVRLIRLHLRSRPLVIALDGEARSEADDLARTLREARTRSLLNHDDSPVVVLRLPEGRDPNGPGQDIYLDITRIRQDTGYQPAYDTERAVADYIGWLRAGNER